MKRLIMASLCAGAALTAVTVFAEPAPDVVLGRADQQETRPDAGPAGNDPASEAKREQVRKKVEAVRMWRMTEELQLDEKTSAQLASFLSSIEDKRRVVLKSSMDSRRSLRAALNASKPDQGRIKSELDKIEKSQRDLIDLSEKEMKGIKSMLTVEQQARYILFQHEFRREMRGMISGARGNGPGPGGPGQGRGPGSGPGKQNP